MTNDNSLATRYPPVMLRLQLDTVLASRWEEGDVTVATLWDDFAKYVYLPRLKDQSVLVETVENGPASVAWETEGFGVAAGMDPTSDRYAGLVAGSHPGIVTAQSLLVKPEFALGQLEAERSAPVDEGEDEAVSSDDGGVGEESATIITAFRGSVILDSSRPTPAFMQISTEVLEHLISQAGADVQLRLEVTAVHPDGFPDNVVRAVTENANTLKFTSGSGFAEA